MGSLRPVNYDQGDRGSAFGLRPHHSPRSQLTGLPLRQGATRAEGDGRGMDRVKGPPRATRRPKAEHGEDGAERSP